MNVKKVLPVTEPMIKSYPLYANLLSILGNYPETLPWIFDNYINLIYINNERRGTILESANDYLEFCPFIKMQSVDTEIISKKFSHLDEYLINNIDCGYYTQVYVDEYYISCCAYYNQDERRKTFATLIYGYDNNENCFLSKSYYKNFIYEYGKINYNEINKAYASTLSQYKLPYFSFKYKENKDYKSNDASQIKRFLIDYLECKDSTGRYFYKNYMPIVKSFSYGISYYENIIKNIEYSGLPTLYVIFDNKTLMLKRLGYMKEMGWMKNYEYLKQKCDEMVKKSEVGINLKVKLSISNDSSILNKMIKLYKELYELDKLFTERLIESIV